MGKGRGKGGISRRPSVHSSMDGAEQGNVELFFYTVGVWTAKWPLLFIFGWVGLCMLLVIEGDLVGSKLVTNVGKLWIKQGGRVAAELDFMDLHKGTTTSCKWDVKYTNSPEATAFCEFCWAEQDKVLEDQDPRCEYSFVETNFQTGEKQNNKLIAKANGVKMAEFCKPASTKDIFKKDAAGDFELKDGNKIPVIADVCFATVGTGVWRANPDPDAVSPIVNDGEAVCEKVKGCEWGGVNSGSTTELLMATRGKVPSDVVTAASVAGMAAAAQAKIDELDKADRICSDGSSCGTDAECQGVTTGKCKPRYKYCVNEVTVAGKVERNTDKATNCDMLHPKALYEHIQVLNAIQEITIPLWDGQEKTNSGQMGHRFFSAATQAPKSWEVCTAEHDIGFLDFAHAPKQYVVQPLRLTVLDCFQEGGFDAPPPAAFAMGLGYVKPPIDLGNARLDKNMISQVLRFLDKFDDGDGENDSLRYANAQLTPYNYCVLTQVISVAFPKCMSDTGCKEVTNGILTDVDGRLSAAGPNKKMFPIGRFGHCRHFIADPREHPDCVLNPESEACSDDTKAACDLMQPIIMEHPDRSKCSVSKSTACLVDGDCPDTETCVSGSHPELEKMRKAGCKKMMLPAKNVGRVPRDDRTPDWAKVATDDEGSSTTCAWILNGINLDGSREELEASLDCMCDKEVPDGCEDEVEQLLEILDAYGVGKNKFKCCFVRKKQSAVKFVHHKYGQPKVYQALDKAFEYYRFAVFEKEMALTAAANSGSCSIGQDQTARDTYDAYPPCAAFSGANNGRDEGVNPGGMGYPVGDKSTFLGADNQLTFQTNCKDRHDAFRAFVKEDADGGKMSCLIKTHTGLNKDIVQVDNKPMELLKIIVADDQQRYAAASGRCSFWDGGLYGLNILPMVPSDLVIGGLQEESNQALALESVLYFKAPQGMSDAMQDSGSGTYTEGARPCCGASAQTGKDPLTGKTWADNAMYPPELLEPKVKAVKTAFVKVGNGKCEADGGDCASTSNLKYAFTSGFSSDSFTDIMKEASGGSTSLVAIGYFLMYSYAMFTLVRCDMVKSRTLSGVCGVTLVILSIIGALGLANMAGITWNATSTQVLPFLLLGLGVDDMFILLENFDPLDGTRSVEVLTGELMAKVGPSITLTSVTNFCAFLIGRLTPLPVVINFSSQAAVGIMFIFGGMWLCMPAILALDCVRIRKGIPDLALLCSCWVHGAQATFCGDRSGYAAVENAGERDNDALAKKLAEGTGREDHNYQNSDGGFLKNVVLASYLRFLRTMNGKICALLLTMILIGVAAGGFANVADGLEMADVVPPSYPEHEFLLVRFQHFSFWPAVVVVEKADYPLHQREIYDAADDVEATNYVIKGAAPHWVDGLNMWAWPKDHKDKDGKLDNAKCKTNEYRKEIEGAYAMHPITEYCGADAGESTTYCESACYPKLPRDIVAMVGSITEEPADATAEESEAWKVLDEAFKNAPPVAVDVELADVPGCAMKGTQTTCPQDMYVMSTRSSPPLAALGDVNEIEIEIVKHANACEPSETGATEVCTNAIVYSGGNGADGTSMFKKKLNLGYSKTAIEALFAVLDSNEIIAASCEGDDDGTGTACELNGDNSDCNVNVNGDDCVFTAADEADDVTDVEFKKFLLNADFDDLTAAVHPNFGLYLKSKEFDDLVLSPLAGMLDDCLRMWQKEVFEFEVADVGGDGSLDFVITWGKKVKIIGVDGSGEEDFDMAYTVVEVEVSSTGKVAATDGTAVNKDVKGSSEKSFAEGTVTDLSFTTNGETLFVGALGGVYDYADKDTNVFGHWADTTGGDFGAVTHTAVAAGAAGVVAAAGNGRFSKLLIARSCDGAADGAGAACALNGDSTACAVDSGDCAFTGPTTKRDVRDDELRHIIDLEQVDMDGDGEVDIAYLAKDSIELKCTTKRMCREELGWYKKNGAAYEAQVTARPDRDAEIALQGTVKMALGDVDGDGDVDIVTATTAIGTAISLSQVSLYKNPIIPWEKQIFEKDHKCVMQHDRYTFFKCIANWLHFDASSNAYLHGMVTDKDAASNPVMRNTGSDKCPAMDRYGAGKKTCGIGNIFSELPLFCNKLADTSDYVKLIETVREQTDKHSNKGTIKVFSTGVPFVFFEQYLTLRGDLWINILYALMCAFAVMFWIMITVQPPSVSFAKASMVAAWAAVILDVSIILIVFIVYGMLGVVGIKLSAIPAVSLIMTVGVAVEFTAHIILAFVVAKGSQDDRMAEALDHMFVPIVNGFVSTFLGVLMMGFSKFNFIFLYFFVLYFLIILVGMLIGIIFLPVCLALAGPPPTGGTGGAKVQDEGAICEA